MSVLVVILLYATWSSIFSIGKWTLQFAPPLFVTGTRMIFAGALLLGYLALRKKLPIRFNKVQWLSIFLLSLLSIYLTNALEFSGLQYLSAGKTCFIYSLSPFFAAFFSYLHFGEKMNSRKWMGMLVGVLGFLPALYAQTDGEGLTGGVGFLSWPSLAIMGAALFSVYGWVLLRLVVKDQEISPVTVNGYSMLFGGLFALLHSYFSDSWNPTPVTGVSSFIQGTLVMTLISNIICYNLYGFLLKRFTATFLSFMGLLSPIFASLNGWILLGETPSLYIFISTGIVTLGLWMVYQEELKQGYIRKSKSPVTAE